MTVRVASLVEVQAVVYNRNEPSSDRRGGGGGNEGNSQIERGLGRQ